MCPVRPPPYVDVCFTSIESPDTSKPQEIPPEYRASQDVFSKQLSTKVPPHQPWDCVIDLLPGATLPHGKVDPLSISKQKAMEEYIRITEYIGYVIDQHGIQMDQRKVQAVENWPPPTSINELQRFLGFANFYRKFINNFSKICSPLTSLIKHVANSLSWNSEATNVFNQLKKPFCTAPTLVHPNPELLLTVEVDASTTGVGAELSQWQGEPPKLRSCPRWSTTMTSVTANCWLSN